MELSFRVREYAEPTAESDRASSWFPQASMSLHAAPTAYLLGRSENRTTGIPSGSIDDGLFLNLVTAIVLSEPHD